MQGKSFATLEIQQSPKDPERKEQDAASESRKVDVPIFVEFDLRAAGVEKPTTKIATPAASQAPASTSASVPTTQAVSAPAASTMGAKGP
jgi:hypothetical protein